AVMLPASRRAPSLLKELLRASVSRAVLSRVFGASSALAAFFLRHPDALSALAEVGALVPNTVTLQARMLDAVGAVNGFSANGDESVWNALRIAYRRSLAEIAAVDLSAPEPAVRIAAVSAALADAAGAALEASLAVARTRVSSTCSPEEVELTQLAIIGMGKAGAREL